MLLSAAAILSLEYFSEVEQPNLEKRLEMHAKLIDGRAVNPYRYRILAPVVVDLSMRAAAPMFPRPQRLRPSDVGSDRLFLFTYLAFDYVCFAAGLLLLFAVLRVFFDDEYALVGSLFGALAYSLTFRDHFYHPWSLLEFPLFGVACWMTFTGHCRWLWLVVLLAAFNRETSVFILGILFFCRVVPNWRSREELVRFALLCALWLTVFIGLRGYLGYPPPEFTLERAIEGNLEPSALGLAFALNVLIFGFFWVFVVRGLRRAPRVLRWASLVVIPYAALLLMIGYWIEIRYWISLFPVLIPLGLFGMSTECAGEAGQRLRLEDTSLRWLPVSSARLFTSGPQRCSRS